MLGHLDDHLADRRSRRGAFAAPVIVHQFFHDLPDDEFPMPASMAPALATSDPDVRFLFGVDVLVAEVDALARPP